LLGWSDLEVLDDRGVEECGQVAVRIVREDRVGTAGGGFGGRLVRCQCRYPGGGDVGQLHRRVGSGHESGEVVHTAADAISRPQ
jgi:hypothetical protein